MQPALLGIILVGSAVAAAAGYLGSFMVLKRMALVGDALSHVALPGIALALTWHFSPMLGAFLALFLAVLGIWYFESTSKNYPEALVGIFFTLSLALGMLLTPEPELLEALFGNLESISFSEGLFAIGISIGVLVITRYLAPKLLLSIISEELSTSMHISSKKINLIYLLLVGSIVAVGVKFVGTLLMGALVIIPAVTARNISKNFASYSVNSILFGIMSAVCGSLIANLFAISTGPTVVLVSIFFFLLTYFVKPK